MDPRKRVYIGEASQLLNRRRATIRGWEREELLPAHLRSQRDERGWRYWTADQIDQISQWLIDNHMFPGRAFAHYNPTPEQIAAHIEKCRVARSGDLAESA